MKHCPGIRMVPSVASKLITLAPQEVVSQFELSLREAFHLLEPNLKPPLKLIRVPSHPDYLTLNRAISYGVLCEPHLAGAYVKHLHAIVTDGYALFCMLLVQIVDELYTKLVHTAKKQLLWLTSILVDVAGLGFENLLTSLMRQIVGGDLTDGNLWLSFELVNLFLLKWESILVEEPDALANALYVYLRLLSDHYRLPNNITKNRELKQKEIEFCLKILTEQFGLCAKLGRDLIRLLQDLFHIPEFQAFWRTLVLEPSLLKAPGFSDIADLYRLRTSSRYFLLRVTPEMEIWLRFLLTSVKTGSERRHLVWFATKFFAEKAERETLVCDIVRFICCTHHPVNEDIQSNIIPRWAVIGWLLKCCTKKHIEANAKLALFFDWLFFDEKVDNFMNIEPAMLLMVNSLHRHFDMTRSLLEFLILLVDNYDVDRKSFILGGVSSAFGVLLQKRVVDSLDVLTSSEVLSPFKEKLKMFQLKMNSPVPFDADHVSSSSSLVSSNTFGMINPVDAAVVHSLVRKLGENLKRTKVAGLETLENILFLYVNLAGQGKIGDLRPEALASKIRTEVELGGYRLFSPLESLPENFEDDDEIHSPTSVIIRVFINSQNPEMKEMLLFWSRNGYPVNKRLLSYSLRLAYEAEIAINGMTEDFLLHYATDSQVQRTCYEIMPLLKFHIDSYFAFRGGSEGNTITSDCKVDRTRIVKLVGSAFSLYKGILEHLRDITSKEKDASCCYKFLLSDVVCCSEWKRKRVHNLFRSVFCFLSDVCMGEDLIRLFINRMEDCELISMQFDLGLKRFSIFGDKFEFVTRVVMKSMEWESIEQHRLWGLIRSELVVSDFPVEKLVLGFLGSGEVDPKRSSLVVGGLWTLTTSRPPTPELVGAILLLPDHKFPEFAASVLASWVTSNAAALFCGITGFMDKLKMTDAGFSINKSAVKYLVSYVEAQGGKSAVLLPENSLLDMKAMI